MQDNFGLDDMLFQVETIMSNVNDEEPSPFLELNPIKGELVGHKFIIGEFKMTDVEYDNGDGQLQYSVSFIDKTKEETDELTIKYTDTINKIVMNMIENIIKNDSK